MIIVNELLLIFQKSSFNLCFNRVPFLYECSLIVLEGHCACCFIGQTFVSAVFYSSLLAYCYCLYISLFDVYIKQFYVSES